MANLALGSVPNWVIFNQNTTLQAAGGKIKFFKSSDKKTNKLVYKDASGLNAYPIEGVPIDPSGSTPIIWFETDEPYYIRFVSRDGIANIRPPIDGYIPNVEGTPPTPTPTEIDFDNYVTNPQFRELYSNDFTAFDVSKTGIYYIAPTYGYEKSNNTSTVSVSFLPLDESDSLEGGPERFLRYDCTEAGVGETKNHAVIERFYGVHTFANETISIAFYGKSSTASTVKISAVQDFGTGGSPSSEVETILGTFDLTTAWTKYEINGALIPSIADKTKGDNNDDFIAISLIFPLNSIAQVDSVNYQINIGPKVLEFEYNPTPRSQAETLPNMLLPSVIEAEQRYDVLTAVFTGFDLQSNTYLNSGMKYELRPCVPVGTIVPMHSQNVDPAFFECNSQTIEKWKYNRLYNAIKDNYDFSISESSATAERAGNVITVTNTGFGLVPDITDADTGYSFAVTQYGDETKVQISTITCNAGSSTQSGSYFLYNTVAGTDISGTVIYDNEFYVVLIVDKFLKIPIVADRTLILVKDILSTDTSEEVAEKIKNVLNPIMYQVPDYRGYFWRVWNHGAGIDPDAAIRTGGDTIGSTQPDSIKEHFHSVNTSLVLRSDLRGAGSEAAAYDSVAADSGATGGNETRPINKYSMAMIKY